VPTRSGERLLRPVVYLMIASLVMSAALAVLLAWMRGWL
jgi:hypothetical protein